MDEFETGRSVLILAICVVFQSMQSLAVPGMQEIWLADYTVCNQAVGPRASPPGKSVWNGKA